MSISSKLFKLFVTVVLLPLIPMALLLAYYQNRQKTSLLENHYNLAEVVSTELSHYAEQLNDRLVFIPQLMSAATEQSTKTTAYLQRILEQYPDFLVLSVLNEQGKTLATATQTERISTEASVQGLMPADPADKRLRARLSHQDGSIPSLEFIYPLASGKYLYGRLALLGLAERLAQMRIGQTGQVYLMDTEGNIQAGPYQWNPGVQPADIQPYLQHKTRIIKSIPGTEGTLVGAISSEPRLGVYMVVLQPKTEALRSFYLSNTVIFLFILAIAMLAYFGAQAFARSLGEPIAQLMEGAKAVSNGDLDHRIAETTDWGEFQELIASFNKMTADLKDYQALQLKNQVSEMKEDIFRSVAHDLRAPLMGLQGYIYILSSGQVNEEQRKDYLARMAEAAQNLSSLLEDVLAVSRVEVGVELPQREEIVLRPLVKSVLHSQEPICQAKALTLSSQIPQGLNVWADPKLLRRILSNLISNAVKFTEHGFVKVTAGENAQAVWISVQDSGCGLTPEQQSHVFEKFRQVNGEAEGYGLGLFISQQLARAHGGEITVTSQTGKGSTFTVTLPKEEK